MILDKSTGNQFNQPGHSVANMTALVLEKVKKMRHILQEGKGNLSYKKILHLLPSIKLKALGPVKYH